jgi:hypothetical protein
MAAICLCAMALLGAATLNTYNYNRLLKERVNKNTLNGFYEWSDEYYQLQFTGDKAINEKLLDLIRPPNLCLASFIDKVMLKVESVTAIPACSYTVGNVFAIDFGDSKMEWEAIPFCLDKFPNCKTFRFTIDELDKAFTERLLQLKTPLSIHIQANTNHRGYEEIGCHKIYWF